MQISREYYGWKVVVFLPREALPLRGKEEALHQEAKAPHQDLGAGEAPDQGAAPEPGIGAAPAPKPGVGAPRDLPVLLLVSILLLDMQLHLVHLHHLRWMDFLG